MNRLVRVPVTEVGAVVPVTIVPDLTLPPWRNSRRAGFKSQCPRASECNSRRGYQIILYTTGMALTHEGAKYSVRLALYPTHGLWLWPALKLWRMPSTDSVGLVVSWIVWDLHFRVSKSRPWWKDKV